MLRGAFLGQLRLDLDQAHAVAHHPAGHVRAAALEPTHGLLLRLPEELAAEDDRLVAIHIHRQHVVALELAVAGGDINRATVEVRDTVASPTADHRANARLVGRLEPRRQHRLDELRRREEVHAEHLCADEARMAERVLDLCDLLTAAYKAHASSLVDELDCQTGNSLPSHPS